MMKDQRAFKRQKNRNENFLRKKMKLACITFDLKESLHAESVLKREKSLVTNHQPPATFRKQSTRERERRQIERLLRVKLTDMMSTMRAAG